MARQVFVLDASPGREVCDFCSSSPTSRLYACRNFIIPRTKHAVWSLQGWEKARGRSPHPNVEKHDVRMGPASD